MPDLKLIQLILLCLFPLGAVAGNDKACDLRNDLLGLHHETTNFLSYLESGQNPSAPQFLRNRLNNTSVVTLRLELRRNGQQKVERLVSRVLAEQSSLLQLHNRTSRDKAADMAKQVGAHAAAKALGTAISSIPCKSNGGLVTARSAIGALNALATGAVPLLFALLIGGSGFVLWAVSRRSQKIKRRAERFPCAIPAQLYHNAHFHPITLADLSQLGSKIKIPIPLIPRSSGVIFLSDQGFEGRIVWSNGTYAGIEFDHPLSQTALTEILHHTTGVDG